MNKILIVFCLPFFVFGCASAEKLTYPRGDWTEINPKYYVPDNTPKYVKDKVKEGVFNEIN